MCIRDRKNVVALASGIKTSLLQRIHNLEQITAIESDQNFSNGNYYDGKYPEKGLALARMIGHKVFISLATLEKRASKEIKKEKNLKMQPGIRRPKTKKRKRQRKWKSFDF